MKMSNKDFLRYSKQIILKQVGVLGQKKISSTKVLIVGMGGLGCPVALYLCNLGINNIGIIDYDRVEFSNLNRQILYDTTDIGKLKVIQAKKKLQKTNTKIRINTYKEKIIKKNIQRILGKYEIICDCSDNFLTRYLLNDFCLKNKKILISAAITDGILPTVAGIAGTLQANEVVKSILNKNNELVGKMIVFNTLSLNFRKIKLTRNADCVSACSKR